MSKIFYDYLILIDEVIAELNQFAIDPEEKTELIDLIDQTLHHHTLDVILNHLPEEFHEEFIARFHSTPESVELLSYLKAHTPVDIELEIKKIADQVKKGLLSDIKKSRHKAV